MRSKQKILFSDMVSDIQKNSPLYVTYKFVEVVICLAYVQNSEDGVVYITQPELCELSDISADTARLVNKILIESGRWEIIPGVGRRVTSYKPLFLDSSIKVGK